MDYMYLKELEGSLKAIIDNPKVQDKKFYEALKDLIDLKLNIEEFNNKFDQIGDVMVSMAKGEFNKRVDIPVSRNLFAFIGTSVNSVIDELERNVIKKSFLETLLETSSTPIIITDTEGIILFSNKAAYVFTNYPPDGLSRLIIKNLFVGKSNYIIPESGEALEQMNVSVVLYNELTTKEAKLNIRHIYNRQGTIEGYIYLLE